MDIDQVKRYCLSFPGVTERNIGKPSNIQVFSVQDKKFAYFKTSSPERWRFSVKVSPERFLELTDQPGINPARYMHRFHWISIVDVTSFNEEYMKVLIHWSYQKALSTLSKKKQAEIDTNDIALVGVKAAEK